MWLEFRPRTDSTSPPRSLPHTPCPTTTPTAAAVMVAVAATRVAVAVAVVTVTVTAVAVVRRVPWWWFIKKGKEAAA